MKELDVVVTANDGRSVKMTARQANTIETINNTRKGGCGSVIGYVPTTNWDIPPVQDIQLITHFSTENLYKRRLKALDAIKYADVAPFLGGDEVLRNLTVKECIEIFEARKEKMMESLRKSLDGDRSGAHRQAHDRCYAIVGDVKVHLLTEGKPAMPIEDAEGNVIVDTIMIPYLELNVTERQKGKRKVVNSGKDVRIGNLITKCLNKRSEVYKTLSLKEDNFEVFRVDHQEFLPEHVTRFGEILLEDAA